MAIVINGSGTVTGLAVGGLPDGTVDAGTLATNSVDSAELIDGAVDSSHLASGVGFNPDAAVVFNDTGADVDFRVEGSGEANALFVQGSDGFVGIGTGTPTEALDIEIADSTTTSTIGATVALRLYSRQGANELGPELEFSGSGNAEGIIGLQKNSTAGSETSDLYFATKQSTSSTTLTEVMRLTADGRGLSQFTAKAWVAWNQTGTPAIRDSHNVSSMSDYGTGEAKVNLTNNMATADSYAVSALAAKGSGAPSGSNSCFTTIGESLAVSGPAIGMIYNGSASDRVYASAIIFGD